MVELDPWSLNEESKITEESGSGNVQGKLEFEDNFVIRSQRLPDSTEYLAILEHKLAKIKKGAAGGSKVEKQELMQSLEASRDSCMYRLITSSNTALSSSFTEIDIELDTPTNVTTKWIKSHVNPEQALTVGELMQLVKADYLAKQTEESVGNKDPSIL